MTEFFTYDELTWPETAVLPRTTPLIIPLGTGYDLAKLADSLGQPERVGLLPAIPFGWRGSGIAVAEPLLARLVANLLDSLREDGFSRVWVAAPQDLGLGLGAAQLVTALFPAVRILDIT